MVLRYCLEVIHEQLLELWQQGEHHCQPIKHQQEAFGQRSLVWKRTHDVVYTLVVLLTASCIAFYSNRID